MAHSHHHQGYEQGYRLGIRKHMSKVCRALGVPLVQFEICKQCIPGSLWIGLLMAFTKKLVESTSIWYILFWALGGVHMAAHHPPQLRCSYLSILDRVWIQWLSLAASYTAWEAKCSLIHSQFPPVREIMSQEGLSWHWVVPPWERGDVCKGKLLLTLFNAPNLRYFFAPSVCYDFSTGLFGLPQRHFCLWVIMKIGVLCGEDSRRLLFHHDHDVTSL